MAGLLLRLVRSVLFGSRSQGMGVCRKSAHSRFAKTSFGLFVSGTDGRQYSPNAKTFDSSQWNRGKQTKIIGLQRRTLKKRTLIGSLLWISNIQLVLWPVSKKHPGRPRKTLLLGESRYIDVDKIPNKLQMFAIFWKENVIPTKSPANPKASYCMRFKLQGLIMACLSRSRQRRFFWSQLTLVFTSPKGVCAWDSKKSNTISKHFLHLKGKLCDACVSDL